MTTISSHLPDLVANYINARAERLALEKKVEAMVEQETMLKDTIIAQYRESGITKLGTEFGTVKMNELIEPVATNWPEVWDYIRQTGEFDLLHKRLANIAVKARWEEGKEIPGVTSTTVFKLTVSKAP
jgi:hypothetical protein